jgi:hypothetical protein
MAILGAYLLTRPFSLYNRTNRTTERNPMTQNSNIRNATVSNPGAGLIIAEIRDARTHALIDPAEQGLPFKVSWHRDPAPGRCDGLLGPEGLGPEAHRSSN